MIFTFLLAITGLTLSGVAIYYSVIGLTAIFAAAFWPIVVMGTTLEISKLVAASWLKAKWHVIPRFMKTYMTIAVFVLMFITSMGIFGFLSKAHIEQTSMSTEQVAQIDTLNDKIARSEAKITRWNTDLGRLNRGEDVRVDNLIANEQEGLDKIYARIKQEKDSLRADAKIKVDQQQLRITQAQDRRDSAIAAAEKKFAGSFGGSSQYEEAVKKAKDAELSVASRAQKEILAVNDQLDKDLKTVEGKYANEIATIQKRIQGLRNQANDKTQDIEGKIVELEKSIEEEQKKIDDAREEKFVYEKEYRKLEAEVGPIKYIAEFIYGDQADQTLLEKAVTWVIITIIFVFDPLAVLMLLASQMTYAWYKENGNVQKNEDGADVGGEDPTPPEEGTETDSGGQDEESIEEPPEVDPVVAPVEEPVEPTLSKKKTDQYLLWPDIDPDQVEHRYIPTGFEEIEDEPYVDPNQLEFDFTFYEKQAHETEEQYLKRIWKKENPNLTIEAMKHARDVGKIDKLPWEVADTTIKDMKAKGEWPASASEKSQDEVTAELDKINDLDSWNEWVEAANKAAEEEPEDTFKQNSEQNENSTWAKINQARQNVDPERIKELTISEEQYRDASQQHIINLINRLKKGLITVSDLSESEANKITKLLKEESNSGKN